MPSEKQLKKRMGAVKRMDTVEILREARDHYRDECAVLAERVRVLEDALRRVESVYDRTQPGPRDACRDQVLEITRKALSGGGEHA